MVTCRVRFTRGRVRIHRVGVPTDKIRTFLDFFPYETTRDRSRTWTTWVKGRTRRMKNGFRIYRTDYGQLGPLGARLGRTSNWFERSLQTDTRGTTKGSMKIPLAGPGILKYFYIHGGVVHLVPLAASKHPHYAAVLGCIFLCTRTNERELRHKRYVSALPLRSMIFRHVEKSIIDCSMIG